MEQTNAPASGDQAGGLASAAGHLKTSWKHGREAAEDVKRTAAKSWGELTGDIDAYVQSRPKAVALGALGAGLVLGFLTGALASRCRHGASRAASEAY